MMDNVLRQIKDEVYFPLAREVGKNVHPITITLVGGGIGLLAALAGWQGYYLLGLGLWLVNRLLDGLDGAMARATGQQSDLGGYVDTLVDFAMYTIIPIGLAVRYPTPDMVLALAFLLGTFYVNAAAFLYLSAVLEKRQTRRGLTSVSMPRGLVEGTEAIIFFCLFFLFPQALCFLFLVLGTCVIFTTFQHITWATRNLK